MTDLFDLAKPVRDTSLKEIERLMAADPIPPAMEDGHRLGAHLVALAIAHTSERCQTLQEEVRANYDVHAVFAVAIGILIGYAGSSFRPIVGGKPLSPTAAGHLLMQKIGPCAMEQLVNTENGTLDFSVSFSRSETGEIQPDEFDYAKMMKGNS